MTLDDAVKQSGRWVIVDMPLPYDPVLVNIDLPLEGQFPKGPYLDAVIKELSRYAD